MPACLAPAFSFVSCCQAFQESCPRASALRAVVMLSIASFRTLVFTPAACTRLSSCSVRSSAAARTAS
ncbi:hypothetical protein D3C71_1733060 [compost metagenome]